MKMFSDCSGPCVVCACSGGGCLAGHGDDDFAVASKARLQAILDTGHYAGDTKNRKLDKGELKIVREWLPRAR